MRDRQAESQNESVRERETGRQTDRQTDRQTGERDIEREKDRKRGIQDNRRAERQVFLLSLQNTPATVGVPERETGLTACLSLTPRHRES